MNSVTPDSDRIDITSNITVVATVREVSLRVFSLQEEFLQYMEMKVHISRNPMTITQPLT